MAALTNLAAPSTKTKVRVSSVLNRNVKEFGAAHLFDGSPDTCWNSGQGTPQWIWLQFHRPVHVHTIQIMFQGGFAGEEMQVDVSYHKPPPPPISSSSSAPPNDASTPPPPATSSLSPSSSSTTAVIIPPTATKKEKAASPVRVANFFPDDDNSLQSFDLTKTISAAPAPAAATAPAGEGGGEGGEGREGGGGGEGGMEGGRGGGDVPWVVGMRLTFLSSFDFYGRVTAYQLAVLGEEVEEGEEGGGEAGEEER